MPITPETDHGTPPVYGSLQALIDRFSERELVQLSDRSGQADAVDETVVARALADAGAEIDGYLAGRYTLPLATVPRVLVNIACDIARYRLYDDRVTEQVQKRYDAAVRFLEHVASGKVGLGLDVAASPVAQAGGPLMDGAERVFSQAALRDY